MFISKQTNFLRKIFETETKKPLYCGGIVAFADVQDCYMNESGK